MSSPANARSRWVWFMAGGCGLAVVAVIVLFLVLVYLGSHGPETDVYAGNEVPKPFLDSMRGVGALEPDERIGYFYSDGIGDILSGFYFVSDRRVVIYKKDGDPALTSVPFAEIAEAHLDREESFFVDSHVTLKLKDGQIVAFPVSSEHEGDVRFVETIRERIAAEDGDVESEAGN